MIDYIKSVLRYDPDSGILYNLVDRHKKALAGQPTGHVLKNGYVTVCIKNKNYLAHRIAFLLMTGDWPKHDLDHVNGNPTDNRWLNLREATDSQNLLNRKRPHPLNTSGYRNVYWIKNRYNPATGSWLVKLMVNRRPVSAGFYDDVELAGLVASELRRKYGLEDLDE